MHRHKIIFGYLVNVLTLRWIYPDNLKVCTHVTFIPLHVIPKPSRSHPEIMCWYFAGMGGFVLFSGDLGSALGIESRGFPSLFFVKTDYILKVEIFVLNGGNIFFLNYQSRVVGGGWTPGHWSVKCNEAKKWNHWCSGSRKGCELTLVSCSLLCSRIYFLFAGKEKLLCTFIFLFLWDCRPGCHVV